MLGIGECKRPSRARGAAGTNTIDQPVPCLPLQGSPGCRQPLPRELTPRGQGSLEQERRWKQYLEDERIALFLQNEEFMKELQRNRDFLLALERGGKGIDAPLWLLPKQSQCRMGLGGLLLVLSCPLPSPPSAHFSGRAQ